MNPPIEIVVQGNDAILNYFNERLQQGIDNFYEAKLLIIGEGGAGKTSFYRRFCYPELLLPAENESTKGIDIHRYESHLDNQKFRLNIWDFGGQEIYHATHQFFLTKRSLYVLLDDSRTNHKTVQDEGFKYWLEVVEALTDNSPMLIFQNEKGGRSKAIDFLGIKGRFDNVKEFYGGNLEFTDSVSAIKNAIHYWVKKLPHFGEALPKKWIAIREELETISEQQPYITQKEYFDIYGGHLPFDQEKALHLSQYLHDLGVFLHFQEDRLLRRTVILQNIWATEAVFKILDDESIKAKFGSFDEADCERLWSNNEYIDMHIELLALMSKFELCYPLSHVNQPAWLAPQLLPASKPEALYNWENPGDLMLRFEYDFLPKGLVNRLMVRQHRYVQNTTLAWRNGVFFETEGNQVLVEVPYSGSAIIFRARGPERKELLTILSADLDALNDTFEGLRGKVHKKIPCNCDTCIGSNLPHFYDYEKLRERKRLGKETIECGNPPYHEVVVQGLLDGVFTKDAAQDVIELIATDNLKEALALLNEEDNDVALLKSRLSSLQKQVNNRVISYNNETMERRQIAQAILDYLDCLDQD